MWRIASQNWMNSSRKIKTIYNNWKEITLKNTSNSIKRIKWTINLKKDIGIGNREDQGLEASNLLNWVQSMKI